MPVVRISTPTFQRLQALAVPLLDSPSTVIERLLDLHDDVKAAGRHLDGSLHDLRETTPATTKRIDPYNPPDLTHTRIVSASLGGHSARSWNELVHVAHGVAFTQLGSIEKVKSISKSNILQGRFRSNGFHFLKDLGVSIQNVNANDAWHRALHMAEKLGVAIVVEVEWENRKGAVYPGERRRLAWTVDKRVGE